MASSLLHVQHQILCLWVGAEKCPTRRVLLQLGQMEIMAFLQRQRSKSVDCSVGHRMLDCASSGVRRDSTSGLILCPDAVNMSDMDRT